MAWETGWATCAALAANPSHFEDSPIAPFLRAFLAVRSRFAEDSLAEAVSRGVRQYVVFGAGLDTFAHAMLCVPAMSTSRQGG